MDCAAVIVAAGSSRRMGFDKLAAPLRGKPVLRWSVERLLAVPEIARVVVVCDESRFEALLSGDFEKPVLRVDGGTERQDSVFAGLSALGREIQHVAVHDGARPLVAPEDISTLLTAAREHRAASLARAVTETLKRTDAAGFVAAPVEREHLWFMETPQAFELPLLLDAYAKVRGEGVAVTDEVSAVQALGIPVKLVASTRPNLKITIPADLDLAAALGF